MFTYLKYDEHKEMVLVTLVADDKQKKKSAAENKYITHNVEKMSSAAMENFVMNVQTLSSQGNFNELNEFLQKNMEILVRNPAHLSNVLETLDVQQHSLGVLAVSSINFN